MSFLVDTVRSGMCNYLPLADRTSLCPQPVSLINQVVNVLSETITPDKILAAAKSINYQCMGVTKFIPSTIVPSKVIIKTWGIFFACNAVLTTGQLVSQLAQGSTSFSIAVSAAEIIGSTAVALYIKKT